MMYPESRRNKKGLFPLGDTPLEIEFRSLMKEVDTYRQAYRLYDIALEQMLERPFDDRVSEAAYIRLTRLIADRMISEIE